MKRYAFAGLQLLLSLAMTGMTVQAQSLAEFEALLPTCLSDCINDINKMFKCNTGDWHCTCGLDSSEFDSTDYQSSACDAAAADTCSADDFNVGSAAVAEICNLIASGMTSVPGGTSEFLSEVRAAATAFDDNTGLAPTLGSAPSAALTADGIPDSSTASASITSSAVPSISIDIAAATTSETGATATTDVGTSSSTIVSSDRTSFVTSSPSAAASAAAQQTSISVAAAAPFGRYAAGNAGALASVGAVLLAILA